MAEQRDMRPLAPQVLAERLSATAPSSVVEGGAVYCVVTPPAESRGGGRPSGR
jgi:hypothetical protein